jgi:DNA-directed RNA polymerase specialized sigma24 family protein
MTEMNQLHAEAVQLREEIIAVKAHLDGLYARRAVLMARMCRDRTTREVAEVFGVKQPLVVNTINGKR